MSAEQYIQRCFQLARLGAGYVAPNPMVGAVLVHDNRVIGEGWHQQYGGPHAEVYCIESVKAADRALIPHATLYCSLEPCFHYGKTPPCVDLVLKHRIPQVVISNLDPNPLVAGQSVQKLREAGVDVATGILEAEGKWLNRVFFHWIQEKSPYIILKWAQSEDGYLGRPGERVAISSPAMLRKVHQWRGECSAILVGSQTALTDNPRLDTRLYPGKNPLRIAFDREGKIPVAHHLLDDSTETWILGRQREGQYQQTFFKQLIDEKILTELNILLTENKKTSLLVEGGQETLNRFIAAGQWHEIRTSIRTGLYMGQGIKAPELPQGAVLKEETVVGGDRMRCIFRGG